MLDLATHWFITDLFFYQLCISHYAICGYMFTVGFQCNWMAWCERDVSDFFGVIFFPFKSAWLFACAFQLSSKPFPCIFFGLVCTLFFRKTKTKYRSVHNEYYKAEQEHFSEKKYIFLLNWKAHEKKIQALLKEKKFTRKRHLRPSCTKPFDYGQKIASHK